MELETDRGMATLICWECKEEVDGVPGGLAKKELGDEGRRFYPDQQPFVCPYCGVEDDFTWEEFHGGDGG